MFDTITGNLSEAVSNLTDQKFDPTDKKDLALVLEKAQVFLVLATLFAVPFFFVPFGVDWFDLPKTLFLGVMIGLISLIGLIRVIIDPKFKITGTTIDKNLLLVVIALIISAALSVNKISSFLADPTQFFLLIAFFFITVNVLDKLDKWKMAFNLFIWSPAVLGLIFFIQTLLAVASRTIAPLQSFLTANSWLVNIFPTNNAYTLILILALALPLALGSYFAKEGKVNPANLLAVVFLALGIITSGWVLFNQRPILLDADTGRKIATGTLGKSYQSALFGISPGQYVSAFSQFKSIDFNSTPYWNLNFTTANSFAFYILTIGGLALFFAFASVLLSVYRAARNRLQPDIAQTVERSIFVSLGLSLVFIIFLPVPMLCLFATFSLLALLFAWYNLKEVRALTFERSWNKGLKFLATGAIFLLSAGIVYGQGRLFLADLSSRQAIEAAAKNRGVDTYNAQVQAAQYAPWVDSYRGQLARTNLALADSLASQANLSDQQKQTVVQLVQQSLAEARNAVALEPNSPANWANLALIYRNLINFASGADQWAVSSESQAIALDPFNPQYYLDLGGIFFAQANYQTAAQQFATAIAQKPDLANSHYNLAQALKKLNIDDQALQQLQLVGQLVCVPTNPSKSDCDKVNSEIAELTAALSKVAGTATPSAQPKTVNQPVENQTITDSTRSAAPNLPKAQTQPPVRVSSPSGDLAQ